MSWIAFAFLAALLATLAALAQKKTLNKEHAMEYSTVMAICAAVLTSPFLFTVDFSSIPTLAYILMYLASILAAVAYFLVSKAVRHSPISTISPLIMFSPGVTAIVAFFALGEGLSLMQLGGLVLLVIGTYVLESREMKDLLHPFKKVFNDKYIKLVFLALLLYGITSTIDKKILGSVAEGGLGLVATSYLPIIQLMIAFNFIALQAFFHEGFADIRHGFKNFGGWILAVAVFTVGYRLSQAHALTIEGSKVALVIAIKRTSALMSTIVGGELFDEKHLVKKTIACLIMIGGALMVIL